MIANAFLQWCFLPTWIGKISYDGLPLRDIRKDFYFWNSISRFFLIRKNHQRWIIARRTFCTGSCGIMYGLSESISQNYFSHARKNGGFLVKPKLPHFVGLAFSVLFSVFSNSGRFHLQRMHENNFVTQWFPSFFLPVRISFERGKKSKFV